MSIDISRLGPAAQKQVRAQLAQIQRQKQARQVQQAAKACKVPPQMGSALEQEYYTRYIWPRMLTGEIAACECQHRFETMPAAEYCGIRLPAAHYTPDFLITYANGTVEAVEVKNKKIRQLQREYIYRRRLFIDRIARPQGWIFTEYIQGEYK